MPTFITLTSFLEQLHNPYKIHFVRNKNLDDQLKKAILEVSNTTTR